MKSSCFTGTKLCSSAVARWTLARTFSNNVRETESQNFKSWNCRSKIQGLKLSGFQALCVVAIQHWITWVSEHSVESSWTKGRLPMVYSISTNTATQSTHSCIRSPEIVDTCLRFPGASSRFCIDRHTLSPLWWFNCLLVEIDRLSFNWLRHVVKKLCGSCFLQWGHKSPRGSDFNTYNAYTCVDVIYQSVHWL